jgi:hypothetical protein
VGRIKIVITEIITEQYLDTENFCTHETPTDKTQVESGYSNSPKVLFERTFETREVKKNRTREVKLLEQEIEDDTTFDLGNVIKAVNGL